MVKVYSTATCAQCPMVKKFLKYKGIEYEEIDVTNDPMRLQKETGFMSVPVIIKEGLLPIVGYNPMELSKIA